MTLNRSHEGNWPRPIAAIFFLTDQIRLAILVEGHTVIISSKLFLILTTGFTEEDFFKVFIIVIRHGSSRPCCLTDQFFFSFFCRWSPKKHSCDIWLQLTK